MLQLVRELELNECLSRNHPIPSHVYGNAENDEPGKCTTMHAAGVENVGIENAASCRWTKVNKGL